MSQPKPAATPPQLADLYRPEALQTANTHVWPSFPSFHWWLRKNRAELQAAEAIVEINGRTYLHGPRTIQVALEAGARRAAARVEAA
jgi:hypothetical protein